MTWLFFEYILLLQPIVVPLLSFFYLFAPEINFLGQELCNKVAPSYEDHWTAKNNHAQHLVSAALPYD